MTRTKALQRLLRPRSIAVIGGDSAAEVARQCRAIQYDGALWAVNPHRAELGGIACVESIEQLPGVPDASFVAAPPEASLQIIQQLAELGAPGSCSMDSTQAIPPSSARCGLTAHSAPSYWMARH